MDLRLDSIKVDRYNRLHLVWVNPAGERSWTRIDGQGNVETYEHDLPWDFGLDS